MMPPRQLLLHPYAVHEATLTTVTGSGGVEKEAVGAVAVAVAFLTPVNTKHCTRGQRYAERF